MGNHLHMILQGLQGLGAGSAVRAALAVKTKASPIALKTKGTADLLQHIVKAVPGDESQTLLQVLCPDSDGLVASRWPTAATRSSVPPSHSAELPAGWSAHKQGNQTYYYHPD